MEKFAIGMLVGVGVGALLATNSYKMRMLVKKGQEEAQTKFNEVLDEKLDEMKEGAKKVKEKAEKKLKKVMKQKPSSAKENA